MAPAKRVIVFFVLWMHSKKAVKCNRYSRLGNVLLSMVLTGKHFTLAREPYFAGNISSTKVLE